MNVFSDTIILLDEAMPQTYKCYRCKEDLSASAFSSDSSKARGVSPICKACNSEYQRKRNYEKVVKQQGIEALDGMIRDKQKHIQTMLEVRAEHLEGN